MTSDPGLEQDKWLLFFDLCARIEGLTAELYHHYSHVYSFHADATRLWKKTALEEENHRLQIEMASRLRDEIESVLPDGLNVTSGIYQKLVRIVAGVKSNPPDLITALKKAIEMEERLVFLHVDSSVKFKDRELQRTFDALRKADQDHIRALRRQLAIETLAQTDMTG